MTAIIPAQAPFFRPDGSFLGYSGISCGLGVDLTTLQDVGPPIPQDTSGRVFLQRILDRNGDLLLENYGAGGPAGRVVWTFTAEMADQLLPPGGTIGRDMTHQLGEVTGDGFDAFIIAPFSLRRTRPGLPTTVLQVAPGIEVITVRYAGAPGPTLLATLIAAGELAEDATEDDLFDWLRNPVNEAAVAALTAIDDRKDAALQALAEREGQAVDDGGAIDVREDEALAAIAAREGQAIDPGGAIDVREDAALTAIAAREAQAIDPDGAIDVRENAALAAIAAREGQAIDPGGAIDVREDAALDAIGVPVAAAVAAANVATTKAGEASASAGIAAGKAGEASASADAASGSAAAAAGSATAAGTAKTGAETARDAAATSATGAAASAADAAAAAGIVSATIDNFGHPAPTATGSAIGATTYVLDWVAPEDVIITVMHTGGLGAGGNVKLKAFDIVAGAWSGAALQTKAVAAGVVDSALTLTLLKGQRLGFYASGVIGTVANGGPVTPYYTIAGDVLAGAIGAVTSNQCLQIGFKVQSAKDYEDAKVGAIDNAIADARTRHAGLADADLGTSLSTTTVYYDPRVLNPGPPTVLYLYGRVAGWATVFLASRSGETQHDVYRQFPVYLDVGKNTITPGSNVLGKGIPRDVVIRPGTIPGVCCPSGGGQVAYTNTDGPGTAGENIIGYRLPQGNFTGTPTMGLQTLTWSGTSNRQLAMEWQILEEASPRKLRPQKAEFLDERFAVAALPTRLMAQGTIPTFSAGKAVSAATGFGNVLRARYGHALHKHTRLVRNNFGSGTSIVASGVRPIGGGYGSAASADLVNNQWTVYVAHAAVSATPAARTTRAWPGTFTINSRLLWRWDRNGRVFRVTLTDYGVQPVVSDYYEVDATVADIPPLVTNPSDSLSYMGQINGALESFALSGSVETSRMWEVSPQRRVTGLIIGDSITNASRVAYADGWAQQIEAIRAANGQETAIIAVDGWAMDNMAFALAHALQLLPDLEWVAIAGGTNRSAAVGQDPRDQNIFEASCAASLIALQGRGITPYFVVPAPHTFSPGAAAQAVRLSYLQGTAWKLIRSDLAVTLADGVSINTGMFYNAGVNDVHFIKPGHDAIVARWKIDAPEALF